MSGLRAAAPGVYQRHRPETTALYEVVRDNIETLFGAINDGALPVRIPRHARNELLAYLDCGLLCGPGPGFALAALPDSNAVRAMKPDCWLSVVRGEGSAHRAWGGE